MGDGKMGRIEKKGKRINMVEIPLKTLYHIG